MKRHSDNAAGFTLLELLIAMTLLGFILTLLFGGMRLAARSWDAGDQRADRTAQLALIQDFLRRELSQIYPYRWRKKTDTNLAFIGEPTSVKLVAPLAGRANPGGLYLISLELMPGSGASPIGSQLVMKRVTVSVDSVDFGALDRAEKVVLAEQVETVRFAYYGAETADATPRWFDRWGSANNRLPFLIRAQITFSDGRVWPELVVAPMIGLDTGCAWNTALNRCAS